MSDKENLEWANSNVSHLSVERSDDDLVLPSGREDVYHERLNHHDGDECPISEGGTKIHISLPKSGAVAHVVADISLETIQALDGMMLAVKALAERKKLAAFDFFCATCQQAVTSLFCASDATTLVCSRCHNAFAIPYSHRVKTQNTTALLQADVFEWCVNTFKGQTLEGIFAHLWEELHELHAECYLDQQIEEIVTCGLLVMGVASRCNVILQRPAKFDITHEGGYNAAEEFETNIRSKLEENKRYKWLPPDEQGVCHRDKSEDPS